MIRHILFWNYTEKVKEEHTQEESLRFMQQSVACLLYTSPSPRDA